MDSLVAVVYRYYPRLGDALYRLSPQDYDRLYQSSPEYRALLAAQQEALDDIARWWALVVELTAGLPDGAARGPARDTTRGCDDVCYAARIDLGEQPCPDGTLHAEVVVLVSFLAPLFVVYESRWRDRGTPEDPDYETVSVDLATSPEAAPVVAVIEDVIARVLGYARLDPGDAATVVPDVQVGNLEPGQATILDALFTDARW